MLCTLSRFVLEEESTWRMHLWKSYQLSHVHQVCVSSPHDYSVKSPLQLFQSIFPRSNQYFLMLRKCLNWQQWFQSVCTRIHTGPWWCYPFITFKIVLDKEWTRWRHLWTSIAFSPPSCPSGLHDYSVKSPVKPPKEIFPINPMFCFVTHVFLMVAIIEISSHKKTLDPENVMCLSLSRVSPKRHDTGICESRISFLMFIRFRWLVPRPFSQVLRATIPRDFSQIQSMHCLC